MSIVNTAVVTRNQLYKEALIKMLERERLIRVIAPSDFLLSLPPTGFSNKQSNVVVFDLAIKRISFSDYVSELERCNLQTRILLYGDDAEDRDLLFFISRGAHGFMLGDQLGNLLISAIKHVAAGGLWFPHRIVSEFVGKVVSEFTHVSKLFRTPYAVSPREQEVWALINQGKSNKEIGLKLRITERTVKFHVTQLLEKFKVSNRRELMLLYGKSHAIAKAPDSDESPASIHESPHSGYISSMDHRRAS